MIEINKIYNEDYLYTLNNLDDKSIDLVVTDPPYKFQNKGGGFYAKNNSTQRVYLDSLNNLDCTQFNPLEMLNILKKKCKKFYGYFFCNKSLIVDYINFAIQNKYNYDVLVMAKSNPIPSFNNHHLSDLEYIIMIREKGSYFSKHKNIDDFRKFFITSCKKQSHPAQKPIQIIERFINVSSKEDDLILDPFMGSGTTALACIQNNRNYIGSEISEKYFNIAKERLEIKNEIYGE